MRPVSICAFAMVIASLGIATDGSAQNEKIGRRGLPYFGAKKIDKAIADPKGYLEKGESSAETRPPGSVEFNSVMSICGDSINWVDVEFYDERFNPPASRKFVLDRQTATAQVQWNKDFALGPNVDPGNVADERWCTGTLIASNLFLTAAHCFEPKDDPDGWQTPKRRVSTGAGATWTLLKAQELGLLMHLNFSYQRDGSDAKKRRIRSAVSFPIVELREYGFDLPTALDYAVAVVGPNSAGKLPREIFGDSAIAAIDTTDSGLAKAKTLTLLQHPLGEPMVVMVGPKKGIKNEWLYYSDLDTLGGSSGSGVLNEDGKVVAVHTNGGCTKLGGANRGVALKAVRTISAIIR